MKRMLKIGIPALFAAGTIIAVAIVAGLAQASAPRVANAQTPTGTPKSDIGVSGIGRVFVTPDIAVANIGVEITAPTLAQATQEASDKMTAVLAAIKAQGVDAKDIQTSSYNVYPLTNQPKEDQVPTITAYRVSNLVNVKIRKIGDVGKVLDAAIAAGANSVNSVYFDVNDPSQAQEQARTAAVKDAMAKAQTLASAANVKVGKITSISEITQGPIPFNRGAFESAPQAAGGAGPVETGSTEISVSVEMHFEIEQ